jgi:hypothetical protein
MVVLRIQAIDALVRFAGEKLVLGLFRPMAVAVRFFPVTCLDPVMLALHFLQEDQVGVEGFDRMPQRMHTGVAAV